MSRVSELKRSTYGSSHYYYAVYFGYARNDTIAYESYTKYNAASNLNLNASATELKREEMIELKIYHWNTNGINQHRLELCQ